MLEKNGLMNRLFSTDQILSIAALRILLGCIFLNAGIGKLFGIGGWGGISGTTAYFETIGVAFPEISAYVVGCVEFIGGSLLILGFLTRLAAFPLAMTMFFALFIVHRQVGFHYPMVIFASCFVLMQLGGGSYSLDGLISRKR